MGKSIRLEEGGQVTLSAAQQDEERRRMRLSVYGPIAGKAQAATVEVLLYRSEARELVVELLRRLRGGHDVTVSGYPHLPAVPLASLVDLICGETVAPAPAGREAP